MSAVDTLPWYENRDNLAAVAHYIVDREGTFDAAPTLLGLIEKPWNFDNEWANFQADDDDPFVEACYLIPSLTLADADDLRDAIVEYGNGPVIRTVPEVEMVREATVFDRDGRFYLRLDARRSTHTPIAVRFSITTGFAT